ncbi:thioredoxin-like protein, putative [Plasmodium gaboni]|uniref:Thioredoxin-like protein, putative n=1 Tax=Plasmodium gaboni TaxID=647221 RepID=A0ABY1UUF3_9APIC|nr:thioredoxin-like protein, putative [Plasmodium gaboni]
MMIKLIFFVLFQVYIICIKNVKSVHHKKFFTINHVNVPIKVHTNQHRKLGYIDLKRKNNDEKKRNTFDNNLSKQKCPLRKVTFKGLMKATGISLPILFGSLMLYNKIANDNSNLSAPEKVMGRYLYKHNSKLLMSNVLDNERSQNIIYYIITNIFNNIRMFINFYLNIKKVKSKDILKEYTILFFHSYNVDRFLQSRNIKTYSERLKEMYKKINKSNNVNVIYIPLDNKLMFNIKHFSNMNNWYSVLFHDKEHILKLIKKYNIMNIPTMVLLDRNMNIINDNVNYLLLYDNQGFPYKHVNNFTYINHVYDKNNNKYNLKNFNSDYIFFYFNNSKDNKEDIQTLLNIKKKLAKKNIKMDIIFIRDIERKITQNENNQKNISDTSNQKDQEGISKNNNQLKVDEKDKNNLKTKDNQNNNNRQDIDNNDTTHDNQNNNMPMEDYLDDVYYLGNLENNVIYKLLLYDIFDVTFKPVSILVNKKGNLLNKYINVSKKENEITSFILNNHKSLNEKVNEKNYLFKYNNITSMNNLNAFSPIFILFSDKIDLDLLKQYNELIEEYNKNRKGKKINFYFLPNQEKKYDPLKKLCSINNTTEMVILDLFNQKLYKENVNNINIIRKLENGKYIIDKEKFFDFVNKYYDEELYASTIELTKESSS